VPLKAGGRRNPVIVTVHAGGCEPCHAYLRQLAASSADLREGDAHLVAITRDAEDGAAALASHLPFPVVVDAEGVFATRAGLDGAAVVIADQWGEVAHVADAGAGHELPSAREIAEWVQYLAIRCPECEGEAM
ncbi:MAG TPA: redoxin domain-containing protein, partial [Longimicrobium sp.]